MLKVVYICTNFNSSRYTIDAYESMMNSYRLASKVIHEPLMVVVDNASRKDEKDLLEVLGQKSNVDIIFSDENLGYFPGLNVGLSRIKEKGEFDIVLVGNNDILFSEGFFQEVHGNIEALNNHMVISPDIVTLDGEYQNPHVVEQISSIRELIYTLYYRRYWLSVVIRKIASLTSKYTARGDEDRFKGNSRHIWQGYGAFYILTNEFLTTFNYSLWSFSFICFEEYWLTRQLESVGKKVYYFPGMRVVHQLHSSFKSISTRTKWEFGRESFRIYRKYIKVLPWR